MIVKFIIAFSVFYLCFAADPNKPVWPFQFDAPFGLNIPQYPGMSAPIVNGTSHFYYSWDNLKATLIDYQQYCLPGIYKGSENEPCKLTFNPAGTYFSSPSVPTCLWIPGIGSVPPNFLKPFNYSGFTQLALDYYGITHVTNLWIGISNFQYWTEVGTGFDIQFVDGGNVLWNFGTLTAAQQNPKIFSVPTNAPACSFSGIKQPVANFDPYLRFAHAQNGWQ